VSQRKAMGEQDGLAAGELERLLKEAMGELDGLASVPHDLTEAEAEGHLVEVLLAAHGVK